MQITITMLTEDLSDAAIATLGEFLGKMTKDEDLNARYAKGPRFDEAAWLAKATAQAPEAVQENAQAEQEAVQVEQEPAQAEPEIPEAPKPKITYAQVRAEATRLVKKDKEQMKEILGDFDAAKLGDVAEADYPKIYERLVSANAR
ncbi:MAG: hypothetical protein IKD61_03665 [Oscillospiraceae bacterium]|nr:hypothetical protein [Oscillospiraceae bacterium]